MSGDGYTRYTTRNTFVTSNIESLCPGRRISLCPGRLLTCENIVIPTVCSYFILSSPGCHRHPPLDRDDVARPVALPRGRAESRRGLPSPLCASGPGLRAGQDREVSVRSPRPGRRCYCTAPSPPNGRPCRHLPLPVTAGPASRHAADAGSHSVCATGPYTSRRQQKSWAVRFG